MVVAAGGSGSTPAAGESDASASSRDPGAAPRADLPDPGGAGLPRPLALGLRASSRLTRSSAAVGCSPSYTMCRYLVSMMARVALVMGSRIFVRHVPLRACCMRIQYRITHRSFVQSARGRGRTVIVDVESRDLEGAREGGKGEGGVSGETRGEGGEGVATSRGARERPAPCGARKTC